MPKPHLGNDVGHRLASKSVELFLRDGEPQPIAGKYPGREEAGHRVQHGACGHTGGHRQ